MHLFKLVLSIGLVGLIFFNACAQSGEAAANYLRLEKIIYHSSHCNGTCPAIDLEIDSNYDVFLKREIWKEKGETDEARSGSFKGKIDPHTYFNLFAVLASSHYADLKFPAIFCCDAVTTTIIIYANGKRTKLSSMMPPKEAQRLISFLRDLALQLKPPPTTDKIEIEE